MLKITRPLPAEAATFYHNYINQVPGDNALEVMEKALHTTTELMKAIPADRWDHRYAPGKWSLKESFLHLIDAERVFGYRALRIARNDQTPLPGFEQDDYIAYYHPENRSPASVISEYRAVRLATLELFRHMNEAALLYTGTASDKPVSVRALAYMIAGHELHHLQLAKEKYLG